MKETPLYQYHREKSRITEFAGFEMPLWYTSISEEHLAVRNRVGIFDISHMGRILLNGPDSDEFLDHLIPTRAALQPPGKTFYTLLLNERGGIEDDLIVLKNAANDYLLVVNALNTSKDLEHVTRRAKEYRQTLQDVFEERLLPLKIPVVTGLPFGHIPLNATLPLGVRVRLDAEAGDLVVLESAVR